MISFEILKNKRKEILQSRKDEEIGAILESVAKGTARYAAASY